MNADLQTVASETGTNLSDWKQLTPNIFEHPNGMEAYLANGEIEVHEFAPESVPLAGNHIVSCPLVDLRYAS